MVLIPVRCPQCHSDQVIKGGMTKACKQRYRCQNSNCPRYSFVLEPSYQGHLPEVQARQSRRRGHLPHPLFQGCRSCPLLPCFQTIHAYLQL